MPLKLCPPIRRAPNLNKDNFGKRWSCEFSAFEPNRISFKFLSISPACWLPEGTFELNISVACHIVSVSTCQMQCWQTVDSESDDGSNRIHQLELEVDSFNPDPDRNWVKLAKFSIFPRIWGKKPEPLIRKSSQSK